MLLSDKEDLTGIIFLPNYVMCRETIFYLHLTSRFTIKSDM